MKYLIVFTALLLTACGGSSGGGSTPDNNPFYMPDYVEWTILDVELDRERTGYALLSGDKYYGYANELFDGVTLGIEFEVDNESGNITGLINMYNINGWNKLAEDTITMVRSNQIWRGTFDSDGREYDIEFRTRTNTHEPDIANMRGEWTRVTEGTSDIANTLRLRYLSDDTLSGQTQDRDGTDSCFVRGYYNENYENGNYDFRLRFMDCDRAGWYYGAVTFDNGILKGAVDNGETGINLIFEIE